MRYKWERLATIDDEGKNTSPQLQHSSSLKHRKSERQQLVSDSVQLSSPDAHYSSASSLNTRHVSSSSAQLSSPKHVHAPVIDQSRLEVRIQPSLSNDDESLPYLEVSPGQQVDYYKNSGNSLPYDAKPLSSRFNNNSRQNVVEEQMFDTGNDEFSPAQLPKVKDLRLKFSGDSSVGVHRVRNKLVEQNGYNHQKFDV